MNPECPLTPALSPDGGEGDGNRGPREFTGSMRAIRLWGVLGTIVLFIVRVHRLKRC